MIGFAGAFVGGILSLLSPCSVMLLPAFFAYAFTTPARLASRTCLFFLGLLASLIPLGVFAASIGGLLTAHRVTLIHAVAIAVIVAGALMIVGVRIPLPGVHLPRSEPGSVISGLSVFLLGTVYALAGVCAGPVLGSVLLVASLGTIPYGITIMVFYALGMTIPLVILALIWAKLGAGAMGWLRPRTISLTIGSFTWINSPITIISGILTSGVGVLLLASDAGSLLPGLVDVNTQSRLEAGAMQATGGVSDTITVTIAALVIALIVMIWRFTRTKD